LDERVNSLGHLISENGRMRTRNMVDGMEVIKCMEFLRELSQDLEMVPTLYEKHYN
jgi:hypothetical protein